ncbi:MAG: hypothetical protein HXX18_07895, partial [Bacteroidetes bacterium]|nr:hypothetical protein [Bacteroidota bacterium]
MRIFKILILCIIVQFFAANSARAVNYYWIGGSGDWSNISHWATSSGSTITHFTVPGAFDNVYFDQNSFTSAGQTITINTNAICADLDFTGSLYSPTFTGTLPPVTFDLRIYGSLTLIPAMNYTFSGQ